MPLPQGTIMLTCAMLVQGTQSEPVCQIGAKLAGVHWWWKTASHAAELTAGYYNTWFHDGYSDVMAVLAQHSARASFTCVEMRDCEHPPEGECSPQGGPSLPSTLGSLCASPSQTGGPALRQASPAQGHRPLTCVTGCLPPGELSCSRISTNPTPALISPVSGTRGGW